MDATEAQAFIERRLLPTVEPTLDASEVADLVAMAGNDTDGYTTDGCYRAIAEGFSIKYGKYVNRYGFTTDGQQFQRNQALDHLEHQRKLYARKVQVSSSTGTSTT